MSETRDGRRSGSVALRYRQGKDRAPQVTAKGRGRIAEKIIQEAKAHGIPVREDPFLMEALMGVDLYREIPAEVYKVVAEIYVFLHRLRSQVTSSG